MREHRIGFLPNFLSIKGIQRLLLFNPQLPTTERQAYDCKYAR